MACGVFDSRDMCGQLGGAGFVNAAVKQIIALVFPTEHMVDFQTAHVLVLEVLQFRLEDDGVGFSIAVEEDEFGLWGTLQKGFQNGHDGRYAGSGSEAHIGLLVGGVDLQGKLSIGGHDFQGVSLL